VVEHRRSLRLTYAQAKLVWRLEVACLAQHPSIEALSPDRQDELLEILREVA
jgi:hypothetical protein